MKRIAAVVVMLCAGLVAGAEPAVAQTPSTATQTSTPSRILVMPFENTSREGLSLIHI